MRLWWFRSLDMISRALEVIWLISHFVARLPLPLAVNRKFRVSTLFPSTSLNAVLLNFTHF